MTGYLAVFMTIDWLDDNLACQKYDPATVGFIKIPKEPHSDSTRTRRSGSVVRKTVNANTDEIDMEEERKRKRDACH